MVFDNHHFGGNVVRAVHPEMGPVIFSQLVFAGDELSTDQKAEVLAPLRALGPVADTVGHWRYVDTQVRACSRDIKLQNMLHDRCGKYIRFGLILHDSRCCMPACATGL